MKRRLEYILTTFLCAAFFFGYARLAPNHPADSQAANDHIEKERFAVISFINNTALNPLDYLVLIGASNKPSANKDDYFELIRSLEKKREAFGNDQYFLEYMFYKIHSKYLKSYQPYSSFSEIIEERKYNCLTATALYALIIDHFDFEFEIIENAYHIYMKVKVDDVNYMIESTDPREGLIRGDDAIAERLISYNDVPRTKNSYQFQSQIDNSIDLYQLVGLHYYNTSVDFYNKGDLAKAYIALNKALIFYHSERLIEFMGLILNDADIPMDQLGAVPRMEQLRWVISDSYF